MLLITTDIYNTIDSFTTSKLRATNGVFIGSDKYYHTVYVTIHLDSKKFYIGKHKDRNLFHDYKGSGKLIDRAFSLHGKDKFYTYVLKYFNTEQAAYDFEEHLITDQMLKSELSYNLIKGGNSVKKSTPGFYGCSKEKQDQLRNHFKKISVFSTDLNPSKIKSLENRHQWKNIKPWQHTMASPETKLVWWFGNVIYDYLIKIKCSRYKLEKYMLESFKPIENYGYGMANGSFRCIWEYIRDGWNPYTDIDWIDFRNSYYPKYDSTALKTKYKFKEVVEPVYISNRPKDIIPWNGRNCTAKSLLVWYKADELYEVYNSNTIITAYKLYCHVNSSYFDNSLNRSNMFVTLLKFFKSGWNPSLDPEWLTFKQNYVVTNNE